MPLILSPSFNDKTRAEIEAHLETVRAKRMQLAVQYHEGRQAKLNHEADVLQKRFTRQYDMLEKNILALDKALEIAEDRLAKCIALHSELGLVTDLIEVRTSDLGVADEETDD